MAWHGWVELLLSLLLWGEYDREYALDLFPLQTQRAHLCKRSNPVSLHGLTHATSFRPELPPFQDMKIVTKSNLPFSCRACKHMGLVKFPTTKFGQLYNCNNDLDMQEDCEDFEPDPNLFMSKQWAENSLSDIDAGMEIYKESCEILKKAHPEWFGIVDEKTRQRVKEVFQIDDKELDDAISQALQEKLN